MYALLLVTFLVEIKCYVLKLQEFNLLLQASLNPETKKHVASFTGLAAALQEMPYYRVYLFDKAH